MVGEDLGNRLEAKGVELEGRASATSWAAYIMAFAPILLLIGFFVWMVRRSRGTGGFSAMQQSKARVIDEQRPDVRFADVAGYEGVKSELSEVIEFLRDPARFKRLGANGPKGVLMLGPPGTGQDAVRSGDRRRSERALPLCHRFDLRRDVRGGRCCPGARSVRPRPSTCARNRVHRRDRRRRPTAGTSVMIGNDEREQTLNQLLAEMDGFDSGVGVVVLAATNRPDGARHCAAAPRALRPPTRFASTYDSFTIPQQAVGT